MAEAKNVVVDHQPASVVRKLYRQVVARRPLGIPQGADRAAIWPFLSQPLIKRFDIAEACEADEGREEAQKLRGEYANDDGQNPPVMSKPLIAWLESGLFSGGSEEAIPAAASVETVE